MGSRASPLGGLSLASAAYAALSAASITPWDGDEVGPLFFCHAVHLHDSRGKMPRADEPASKPGGKPTNVATVKYDEDALQLWHKIFLLRGLSFQAGFFLIPDRHAR